MKTFAVVACVAGVLAGCGPEAGEFTSAKLMQAVQTNPQRIAIADYVTNEWDRFCVFGPYTPPQIVQQHLGFEWRRAESAVPSDDGTALLVFVRGNDVVQTSRFERRRGDFTEAPFCVLRERAVFRVANPDVVEFRQLVRTD